MRDSCHSTHSGPPAARIGGGLVHRRDREFCTLLHAGRPARGDGLGLGVETHRIRTVLVPGGVPIFPVSLPFFNASESFRLNALYTGKPSLCEVACRLPDTTVEVFTRAELSSQSAEDCSDDPRGYRLCSRNFCGGLFTEVVLAVNRRTVAASDSSTKPWP
jgi:hypothetical protein